jgi:hypothetical protein
MPNQIRESSQKYLDASALISKIITTLTYYIFYASIAVLTCSMQKFIQKPKKKKLQLCFSNIFIQLSFESIHAFLMAGGSHLCTLIVPLIVRIKPA